MPQEVTIKTVSDEVPVGSVLWLVGWLFTVGCAHLHFWSGFWALIVWPYYLGGHFGK